MSELSIRPASASDVSAIAALENECFSNSRDREMILRHLPEFLVAERNGIFVGYADCSAVLDEGYIGNIAVVPSQRSAGVGRSLLHAMLSRAQEQKLSFLTLEVRAGNIPAIALYEHSGFQKVGVRKNYYERPTEDASLYSFFFSTE